MSVVLVSADTSTTDINSCSCSLVLCLVQVVVKVIRFCYSNVCCYCSNVLSLVQVSVTVSFFRSHVLGPVALRNLSLSLSACLITRVPCCTNVLCSCVWDCCHADIVSPAKVVMTSVDVASCVCLCWCYVYYVRVLTLQEETSSVTHRRKRESKPIGPVWTALIAVEPNLLLLYFIRLSKHLITYRPL